MKKVLLSCVALAAGTAMAMAQAMPEYPEKLDITLNGEKELPGVTVAQTMEPYDGDDYLTITVSGEYDGDFITLDFPTPAGWDSMLVYSSYSGDVEDIEPLKSKAPAKDDEECWMPLEYAGWLTPSNSLTFPVDGFEWSGLAYLVKGDNYYVVNIDFVFNVAKAGGSDVPVVEGPVFPDHFVVDTFDEGVEVTQGVEWGVYTIKVEGEVASNYVSVVIDTPEGWDGLISKNWGNEGEVIIEENNPGPRATRAEEVELEPISDLGEDFIKGNRFTFETTYVPGFENYHTVEIRLYKGDMASVQEVNLEVYVSKKESDDIAADNQKAYEEAIAQLDAVKEKYDAAVAKIKEVNPDFDFSMYEEIPAMIEQSKQYAAQALSAANEEGVPFSNYFYGATEELESYISMMLMEGDPAPEFPASFDVTLSSNAGVELTTDDTQGVFIINVAGKSAEKEITVTIALPEGFDGIMHISDLDMMDPGIEVGPLSTRADEPEWCPVSWALEEGLKEGNSMTFPVDGNNHAGQFFLCKNGFVDINNQVNVEFEVEYDEATGVSGLNAAENATYYDIHGNQIAKPSKGIYVKVVDGKASKVIVK